MMRNYGLIGYPLSHSFSPGFFNDFFAENKIEATYVGYSLEKLDEFEELISRITFSGMNVTIPFKEKIISFLDELDPIAEKIGAVNTIAFVNGKKIGYNTDAFGFEVSLLEFIKKPEVIYKALVLGSGGASKAVCFVLQKLGIEYKIVSTTTGDYSYSDLSKIILNQYNLIINTTPLGMFPNEGSKPDIPYKWLDEKYFLYDLVYNPEKTLFLSEGSKKRCRIKNGYDMLIMQAKKAWQIWNQPETLYI